MPADNTGTITGNLARDPEMVGRGSVPVAKITVAVNGWNSKTKTREAEFFPITLFGKTAEWAEKYLTKGSGVVVRFHLGKNKWVDKAGQNRNDIQLIGDEATFGPKSGDHKPASGARFADEDGDDADLFSLT